MGEYRLSPKAEQDISDIWRYIAPENENAADALLLRMFAQFEVAADMPAVGSPRPELSPTARILVEGRYVIIYEPMSYGIMVVAVVHGMRSQENWL